MSGAAPRPLDWGLSSDDGFVALPEDWIEQPVIAAFLHTAARHGDRPAVFDGIRRWSYAQLAGRVARFSAQLADACPPGTAVALALANDARAPAAMLAALAAGLPYVPIDLSFPDGRNAQILAHAGVGLIVTTADRAETARALAHGAAVLVLDEDGADPCVTRASPDDVAYVLYTSGSTGQPKGVFQNQRNLLHDVRQYINSIHLSAADRTTLLYSPSVNGAIRDIFGTLLAGAALHVLDLRQTGLGTIAQVLRQEAITVYHSMPPVLRTFLNSLGADEVFPSVRLVYLAGDRLFRSDVALCRRHFPASARLYIGLGSTENATLFRQWIVTPDHPLADDLVPVGFAVADRPSVVVDERGTPVAPGEVGEIVVSSRHMALGYWNAPDLTAATFRPCPDDPLARTLHTGDLGREGADGLLHFIGRKDRQIKIRGYRVEPAEVEAVLRTCPGIADAAVIARQLDERAELVAFVTGRGDSDPQSWLAARLPAHLRPAAIVPLGAIPTLPNLKTDVAALTALDDARRAALAPPAAGAASSTRLAVYAAVWTAWTQKVGPDAFQADLSWEAAGGDSLQALAVVLALETQLGQAIVGDLFTPQIRPNALVEALVRRLDGRIGGAGGDFRTALRHLAGDLPIPDGGFDGFELVAANATGPRPPLFWCMQHEVEHTALAQALGPDQPLYGMRSGHPLPKSYPLQRLLGRHYAARIMAQAAGPYVLGGNCQGGHVAFETAQALREAGQEVRRLILLDTVVLRPYAGAVALLFGAQATTHNPFLKGEDPRPDWHRLYAGHTLDFLPCAHGQYFLIPANVAVLAERVREYMAPPAVVPPAPPPPEQDGHARSELAEVAQELHKDAALLLGSRSWRLGRALRNGLNRALGRGREPLPAADLNWRHSLAHIRAIRASLSWELTAPLRLPAKLRRRPPPPTIAAAPSAPMIPLAPACSFHAVVDAGHHKAALAFALAASWHAQCRPWSSLHLTVVGSHPTLERFAAGLGISVRRSAPHPLAGTLPFANKWLAAEPEAPPGRAILVDTDVMFLGDPWLLRALPAHGFAARPAPALRLPPRLQDWAADRFALPPGLNMAHWGLAQPVMAGAPLSSVTADAFIRRFRYYNSGVMAFPAGQMAEFTATWQAAYRSLTSQADEIRAACGEDGLAVATRSDQLALAIALADQPVFPLECSHNFTLSDATFGASDEDVSILHLAGALPDADLTHPAAIVTAYDRAMARHDLTPYRRFQSARLRQKICALAHDYGLHDLTAQSLMP